MSSSRVAVTGAIDAPLQVVAALCFRAGRVLVAQRLAHAPLGGAWEFPGGKLEPGEGPEAALRRELHEELGVRARVGPLAWDLLHRYPVRQVRLRLYHVWLAADAVPVPQAAQALVWQRPADLGELDFCAADVPMVAALQAGTLRAVAPDG